jgi:hypothetical protein
MLLSFAVATVPSQPAPLSKALKDSFSMPPPAAPGLEQPNDLAAKTADGTARREHSRSALVKPIPIEIDSW